MLPPNPLDLPPDLDVPHSWCNFMYFDNTVWQTLHTSDQWDYCFFLEVDSMGALVIFYKRTAPLVFRPFGIFREGLEKTEEWFASRGVDIPGWAEWIKRYKIMAQSDATPDHEIAPNGIVIGGHAQPFYWDLERFYAEQYAKNPT